MLVIADRSNDTHPESTLAIATPALQTRLVQDGAGLIRMCKQAGDTRLGGCVGITAGRIVSIGRGRIELQTVRARERETSEYEAVDVRAGHNNEMGERLAVAPPITNELRRRV